VLCAKSSLSYGEDEEAIEITEISEECEDNLIMDEGILLMIVFFNFASN